MLLILEYWETNVYKLSLQTQLADLHAGEVAKVSLISY